MDVTTTIINEIIYTFFATYTKFGHYLHAIMKTWALCCMLQWKLGHFVACYNENLCSFFQLLKQFFLHFFACNKEIYGTFIFATKQIFLWRHPWWHMHDANSFLQVYWYHLKEDGSMAHRDGVSLCCIVANHDFF